MMAEALAAGVLGSLISPRGASAASFSNGLRRATRSKKRVSLASNFFSPTPRRPTGAHRPAPVVTAVVGNVLYCQSWAYPASKEWIWKHDGPLRTLLLEELEEFRPSRPGVRGRRGLKSNRGRLRGLAPRKDSRTHFFQFSYSTSSQTRPVEATPMAEASSSQHSPDDQAAASASSSPDDSHFRECIKLLMNADMKKNIQGYQEELEQLPASGIFSSAPFLEVLHFAELLADQIDGISAHRLEVSIISRWGNYLLSLLSTLGKRSASSSSPSEDERIESLLSRAHAFMGQFPTSLTYLQQRSNGVDSAAPSEQACFDHSLLTYVLANGAYHGTSSAVDTLSSMQADHSTRLSSLFADSRFRHFLTSVHKQHTDTIRDIMVACRPPLSESLQEQILSQLDTNGQGLQPEAFRQWDLTTPSASEIRAFDTRFPVNPGGPRRTIIPHPGSYDRLFNTLAFGARFETSNILKLLEDMICQGHTPPSGYFQKVILEFRATNNKSGVFDTLKLMEQGNVVWSFRICTTLISFFAHCMDMKAAIAVHDQALKQGGVPPVAMNNALLYAYARTGHYQEARRFFESMLAKENGTDAHTYNTMMKAALLRGTSFAGAMKFYVALKQKGITPNVHTYGTLIDAAAKARRMSEAKELYQELLGLEEKSGSDMVTLPILTSMVAGSILLGWMDRARDMLAEMKRRGLEPNAITYKTIRNSFTMRRHAGQDTADEPEILKELSLRASDWDKVKHPRQTPLALATHHVFTRYLEQGNVYAAEAVLDSFVTAGGIPTLSQLTLMLTLYSDTNQAEKALALWPVIMDAAKFQARTVSIGGEVVDTQMARITVPLSIYTRLMSKAGYHTEAIQAWVDLVQDGSMPFDEGNWNDYVLACLRAGRPLQAFEAAENLLVSVQISNLRQYESMKNIQRLSQRARSEQISDLPDAFYQVRPVISQRQRRYDLEKEGMVNYVGDDLYDNLDLSRVYNPRWKSWRLQTQQLLAMDTALRCLRKGYLLRATRIDEECPKNVAPSHRTDLAAARALLKEIRHKCPMTIANVHFFLQRLEFVRQRDRQRKPLDKKDERFR